MTNEIESRLNELLPLNPTSEVNPEIPDLTRKLIELRGRFESPGYTHSVCHLFEKYGEGRSYLNSDSLLPVAEELVNCTLRKALGEEEFGCVERIIKPIMELNLTRLNENQAGFIFRPQILTDPEIIRRLEQSRLAEYIQNEIEFCKSGNMGEFFPKYVETLRKQEGLEQIKDGDEITPGVYIDVEDTLIGSSYDEVNKRAVFNMLPLTQDYALRKLSEGVPVRVFTGGDPDTLGERLKTLGLDERLLPVSSKNEFIGRTLETCIDDTSPGVQGFRAKTHYKSGKMAWDAEYSS